MGFWNFGEKKEPSLLNDLSFYVNELYTKRDLQAGLELVKEVAGMISLGGALLATLTVFMPALGITLSSGVVSNIISQTAIRYAQSNAVERKQIRAAVSWIKGGFSLGDRLIN